MSTEIDSLMHESFNFIQKGQDDKALICLKKVVNLDNNHFDALAAMGEIYLSFNQNTEAYDCFTKCIKLRPEHSIIYEHLGFTLKRLHKYEKSIENFIKSLERDPNNSNTWNNLGDVYGMVGDHNNSLICFDKAIELNNNFALAWSNKGSSLRSLGRMEEALTCSHKALELGSNDEQASLIAKSNIEVITKKFPTDSLKIDYCIWCGQDVSTGHSEVCPISLGYKNPEDFFKSRMAIMTTIRQKPGGPVIMGPIDKKVRQRVQFEHCKDTIRVLDLNINELKSQKHNPIKQIFVNKEIQKFEESKKNCRSILVTLDQDLDPEALNSQKIIELKQIIHS
jgi:Tfp pilus assembly protein PilF